MATQLLAAEKATRRPSLPRFWPRAAFGLVALCLSGCSSLSVSGGTAAPAATVVLPARPADPLAAFAARAQLGQQEMVGSPPVMARLMRSYNSGAGRPCRELLLGGSSTGRQALYCEESPGQWSAVRPLLRGGGTSSL